MHTYKVHAAVSDVKTSYGVTSDSSVFPIKGERIGYIYTGDSRMRRLNLTIKMRKMEDTWVVCKSGMGYSWFKLAGLPKIKQIMTAHPSVDRWVIISGWGVNDLWNRNMYINTYRSLMKGDWKGCSLYLMSVNPVNGKRAGSYTSIPVFNSALKQYTNSAAKSRDYYTSNPKLSYIDTNTILHKKGFYTIDGLHYTEGTNRLIYQTVREKLDKDFTRINYTGLEININGERTLRLLDDNYYPVKWKSSDKKVAKVVKTFGSNTQNAVIKAVSEGTATITAKSDAKTYECTISVCNDKVLIAYYYHSDALKSAAKYLQKRVGGKIYQIDSGKKNPIKAENKTDDINDVLPVSGAAIRVGSEETAETEKKTHSYDKIYIVFPVQEKSAPEDVNNFIKESDLVGREIYPLCTSEEIELQLREKELTKVIKKIKKKVPAEATMHDGLVLSDEKADSDKAKKKIRKWTGSQKGNEITQ